MHARHFLQLVLLSAVCGASFPLIRTLVTGFDPFRLAASR